MNKNRIGFKYLSHRSDHAADEVVDEVLSVTPVTSSLEWVPLLGESTSGTSELEGPDEVVGLLEVRADGVDLVDEVLH